MDNRLNIKHKDELDYRTNYGKHNRLVVGMIISERKLNVREDIQGFAASVETDRQAIIKKDYPQCRDIVFLSVEFVRSSSHNKFYDSLHYTYTFKTKNG